ncbi:MAG: hypothetical protein AAFX09_08235 [Pseudomonadota bacterium]
MIRETDRQFVLDASVIINLHASGLGTGILSTLTNPAIITEEVLGELREGSDGEPKEREFADRLIRDGVLNLNAISGRAQGLYFDLVSDPRSLDDGEASTLAVALANEYVPVIDERKARRELVQYRSQPTPPNSLDLFCNDGAVAEIGNENIADAVYLALREANMRIQPDQCDFVVDLIGLRRAIECNSLPNFKSLKVELLRRIGSP